MQQRKTDSQLTFVHNETVWNETEQKARIHYTKAIENVHIEKPKISILNTKFMYWHFSNTSRNDDAMVAFTTAAIAVVDNENDSDGDDYAVCYIHKWNDGFFSVARLNENAMRYSI